MVFNPRWSGVLFLLAKSVASLPRLCDVKQRGELTELVPSSAINVVFAREVSSRTSPTEWPTRYAVT